MKKLVNKLALVIMLAVTVVSFGQTKRSLNNFREPSKLGINVFEAPKDTATTEFNGVKVRIGGASTLQFQAIDHENGNGDLTELGSNFNLATANLDLDVQLHDGLRMHLRTYLSARHHREAWVKGGYLQVDNLNWLGEGTLSDVMKYVTVKIGHMQNNYGDMHFRRSDNAMALYNPFVGNAIMDAFTTEVGGEIYYRNNGWIAMVGLTNGKLNQGVTNPETTSPAILAKLGWDKQIDSDLRVRLTGSLYNLAQTRSAYLYTADRAGSRYYLVMDNTGNATSNFRTGRFDPGFRNQLSAIQFNPFIKYKGLEFFGIYELSSGREYFTEEEWSDAVNEFVNGESDIVEAADNPVRNWTQIMAEVLYRFGSKENFYIGARYNNVSGEYQPDRYDPSQNYDVSIDRFSVAAGFFFTKNVLAKLEYVTQSYNDFEEGDIYNDGKFDGIVLEAVISF